MHNLQVVFKENCDLDVALICYLTLTVTKHLQSGDTFVFVPAVLDMQQVYDMWLTLNSQTRQADVAMNTQPIPQEKYIVMPTDYAEQMVGTLLFFRFCVFFPECLKKLMIMFLFCVSDRLPLPSVR